LICLWIMHYLNFVKSRSKRNPLGKAALRRLGLGASISASDGACTGIRDGAMARVEVITGRERRRRWTEEQKRAIVAEFHAAGMSRVARAPRCTEDKSPLCLVRRRSRSLGRIGFVGRGKCRRERNCFALSARVTVIRRLLRQCRCRSCSKSHPGSNPRR